MLMHTTLRDRKMQEERVEHLKIQDETATDSWIPFTIGLLKDVTLETSHWSDIYRCVCRRYARKYTRFLQDSRKLL